MSREFLRAEWRNLAMINYSVDPALLRPILPAGTELDLFEGETLVSMVGFQFLKTKVLGLAIPWHRNFEEVNLRYYVRAKSPEGWRRGVVFVRELVPRRAIALIARTLYGEPYSALPMRHEIREEGSSFSARYEWYRHARWESLQVSGTGAARAMDSGSLEEFITEHYWGFTSQRAGSTQYQVEHPQWKVRSADRAVLDADIAGLYGERFVESLSAQPRSAFLAEGSAVVVRSHSRHADRR